MATMPGVKTDEDLVQAYQKRGDIAALNELRSRVSSVTGSQVARYLTGPGHISKVALEARADELFVDAAKSYDAKAGASFRTHLFNYLRRLDRYTKANANVVHMPEARANLITTFTTQHKILEDKKQRQPTDEELADHLAWPISAVKKMKKSLHRELPWSQVAGPQEQGMEKVKLDALFEDIRYELAADEREVFDLLMGIGGKKRTLQGQDIAKATGFSQAKVSLLRKRIAEKMKPYLGHEMSVTM